MYPPHISPLFENRYDAGRQLAAQLSEYLGRAAVVLAIPNGGVMVAGEIARVIDAELDVVIVRKLPLPLHPEAGFGALADDGSLILNEELVRQQGLSQAQINEQVGRVTAQIRQRSLLYRKDRQLISVRGKTAIIADDGLASGYTMLAAVASVRRRRAKEVVVAVPVASSRALAKVKEVADRVVTIAEGTGTSFTIADYYRHWHDVRDADVVKILEARQALPPRWTRAIEQSRDRMNRGR